MNVQKANDTLKCDTLRDKQAEKHSNAKDMYIINFKEGDIKREKQQEEIRKRTSVYCNDRSI